MIPFTISTRGKRSHARWCPNPDRISIYINKIAEIDNPEEDFDSFIAQFCTLEFHELAHVYGFRNGCHPVENCRSGKCYLCSKINVYIFAWFKVDMYLRRKQ